MAMRLRVFSSGMSTKYTPTLSPKPVNWGLFVYNVYTTPLYLTILHFLLYFIILIQLGITFSLDKQILQKYFFSFSNVGPIIQFPLTILTIIQDSNAAEFSYFLRIIQTYYDYGSKTMIKAIAGENLDELDSNFTGWLQSKYTIRLREFF